MLYLKRSHQQLRQLAVVMEAAGELKIDATRKFAYANTGLLQQSDVLENELSAILARRSQTEYAAGDSSPNRIENTIPTVFISYSTEDSHFARSLSRALKERSIGVWFDDQEIRVGDSLTERIGEALHAFDFIIVVLSPASVKSRWVQKELAEAMMREIKQKRVIVLPVIYRQCEIPPFLTDKKYADFTADSDSALNLLVNSIERHHGSPHLEI
jgi:predicted nucleotide-binding protein